MIGGQDLCLEGRLIGIAAWVLTTTLTAGFAAILLFSVGCFAMADQVGTAAVIAGDNLDNHDTKYTTNRHHTTIGISPSP